MAKQNNKTKQAVYTIKKAPSSVKPSVPLLPPFLQNFWIQSAILLVVGLACYWKCYEGEYALDDGIVISQNQYVQHGFAGIDTIMSRDAYDSFYRQMNSSQQLSGGRYRPLSLVTFAIEQEFWGKDAKFIAKIRHVINVLLYILSVIILLYFFKNFLFKTNPDLAFLSCLLFMAHPIHSEAIANIKSRDELLSFLFIIITFIFSFRYVEGKNIYNMIIALVSYFLAFLSKEYAIVLIVLVPVSMYIFYKKTIAESAFFASPYLFIFIVYFVCRINSLANSNGSRDLPFSERFAKVNKHIENPEVLNNPYIYVKNPSQKWATKISTISIYLKLLVFPHPLSSDYSYNQISYKNLTHWSVWLSLFLHFSLIYYAWKYIKQRHLLGFAIFTYLAFLGLVGNVLMDIGATMGERLIFHSSLGFSIACGYFILEGFQKINGSLLVKRAFILLPLSIVVTLYGFKCYERSVDWKNDRTLFIKDVATVPNSVLANGNAGARWIDMASESKVDSVKRDYLHKALGYLDKALFIHPKYVNGYLNKGLAHYQLKELEKSELAFSNAAQYFPNNPYLKQFLPLLAAEYVNRGFQKAGMKDYTGALNDMEKAVQCDPYNYMNFYHLGGAYYSMGQYDKAKMAWQRCLKINPNYAEAQKGINALNGAIKN